MTTRWSTLAAAVLLGLPLAAAAADPQAAPGAQEPAPSPPGASTPAALPREYRITIVQGASRADVERLTSGRGGRHQASGSTSSGPQTTTLRVTSGQRANIETGHMIEVVEQVFLSGWGDGRGVGVGRRERPVTRGFTVLATPKEGRVEVQIEASIAREGRDDPANRQVQNLRTTLRVREGEWVELGGGGASPERGAKTYGTATALEQSSVLLRVDRVRP